LGKKGRLSGDQTPRPSSTVRKGARRKGGGLGGSGGKLIKGGKGGNLRPALKDAHSVTEVLLGQKGLTKKGIEKSYPADTRRDRAKDLGPVGRRGESLRPEERKPHCTGGDAIAQGFIPTRESVREEGS